MTDSGVELAQMQSLGPSEVQTWMRARGWTPEPLSGGKKIRYVRQLDGDEWEVEIPSSFGLRDYARRLREALDVISRVERLETPELLSSIRDAQVDQIRLRIHSESTRFGRVPVDAAATLYQQARDVLLAAACATVRPRASFPSRKPPDAVDYLRSVRFAPSQAGSYVLKLESPVPPSLQPTVFEQERDAPFARRVTRLLGRALQATRDAAGQVGASGDIEPFALAVSSGLSSNLCDALAAMMEPFDGAILDASIGYAASRPTPEPHVSVRFGFQDSVVLREAARLLRGREPVPDYEVEGIVAKLESKDSEAGGDAWIAATMEGRGLRRIRVSLRAEDYQKAITSHRERRPLRLEGELVQSQKGFRIENCRGVELGLDEPED